MDMERIMRSLRNTEVDVTYNQVVFPQSGISMKYNLQKNSVVVEAFDWEKKVRYHVFEHNGISNEINGFWEVSGFKKFDLLEEKFKIKKMITDVISKGENGIKLVTEGF